MRTRKEARRSLVWAHGDWRMCELHGVGTPLVKWLYVGSLAFCCYDTEATIIHPLPPKPEPLDVSRVSK